MTETSLYQRLGGKSKIRAIAADIFDNHAANPLIKARYANSDRERVIRVVGEFICAGTGGPQAYTGRDMLTTHRGMDIDEEEFRAVVDDIIRALKKNDVGEEEEKEMLAIVYSLKGEIVGV